MKRPCLTGLRIMKGTSGGAGNDGAAQKRGRAAASEGSKIAFIGGFAEHPRYQGGGSSHINAYHVDGALEAVQGKADVIYAKGFDTEGDQLDETLLREAVAAAKTAQVAVICRPARLL